MTLAEYINRHNLTHTEFAAKAGIGRNLVTRYLGGTRSPGLRAALLIERATRGAVPVETWTRRKAT